MAVFVVLCSVGMVVVLSAGQLLIASANQDLGRPPSPPRFVPAEIRDENSADVRGWMVHGRPERGAVLLLHGVRSNHRSMVERARFLHDNGYAVLMIDLYAYGGSPGDNITFGYRESDSVVAAIAYARKVWPLKRLAIVGSSLGGAAAVIAANRQRADAYVLEAVYSDLQTAIENRLRIRFGVLGTFVAPLLLWQIPFFLGFDVEQLSIESRIGVLDAPLLMIAGELDRRTTLDDTRRLFDGAEDPKALWVVPQAAHQDLYRVAGADYEWRILRFFARFVDNEP